MDSWARSSNDSINSKPTPDGPPGIVGFGLRNPDGSPQGSVGIFPNLTRTIREQFIPRSRRKYQPGWRIRSGPVDWVTGACMLVNSEMIAALGGMDEDFFLYHEEVAFSREAQNQGWTVEYDPSVTVIHRHPLQNRPISPMMRVITRHSKLLYFLKHLPRWQFESLAAIVSVEAAIRGFWSRLVGSPAESRAWGMIAEITRAMAQGVGQGAEKSWRLLSLSPYRAHHHRAERIDVQGCKSPALPSASSPAAGRASDRFANALTGLLGIAILGLLTGLVLDRKGNLAWDDADYLRRGLSNCAIRRDRRAAARSASRDRQIASGTTQAALVRRLDRIGRPHDRPAQSRGAHPVFHGRAVWVPDGCGDPGRPMAAGPVGRLFVARLPGLLTAFACVRRQGDGRDIPGRSGCCSFTASPLSI